MLYNTGIQLTYKSIEGDDSDTQYRKELLTVFNLSEFDLDKINTKIDKLYHTIEFDDEMRNKMKEYAGNVLSEDELLGFMMCFSYDQFHDTHTYICNNLPQSNTTCNDANEVECVDEMV